MLMNWRCIICKLGFGCMFFHIILNSKCYVRLSPFFTKNKKNCSGIFTPDNAMAHTVNNSMDALDEIFGKLVVS